MHEDIKKLLNYDENVIAKIKGRVESAIFGRIMYPSMGIVLATNQRILYFEKTTKNGLCLEEEFSLKNVKKAFVYRDFFTPTLGICKTLSIQNDTGDLIRLVAPYEYEEFLDYVNKKISSLRVG